MRLVKRFYGGDENFNSSTVQYIPCSNFLQDSRSYSNLFHLVLLVYMRRSQG